MSCDICIIPNNMLKYDFENICLHFFSYFTLITQIIAVNYKQNPVVSVSVFHIQRKYFVKQLKSHRLHFPLLLLFSPLTSVCNDSTSNIIWYYITNGFQPGTIFTVSLCPCLLWDVVSVWQDQDLWRAMTAQALCAFKLWSVWAEMFILCFCMNWTTSGAQTVLTQTLCSPRNEPLPVTWIHSKMHYLHPPCLLQPFIWIRRSVPALKMKLATSMKPFQTPLDLQPSVGSAVNRFIHFLWWFQPNHLFFCLSSPATLQLIEIQMFLLLQKLDDKSLQAAALVSISPLFWRTF